MAQARIRHGYRRIQVLLNREGWEVGKKLVYRLYRQERLELQQRRPLRSRVAVRRRERLCPTAPNQVWSLDFVSDQLGDGRRFRALTVLYTFTRESLASEVGQNLTGPDVVRVLSCVKLLRGIPRCCSVTTAQSLPVRAWICGLTRTVYASTSRARASQPTMPSWRPEARLDLLANPAFLGKQEEVERVGSSP